MQLLHAHFAIEARRRGVDIVFQWASILDDERAEIRKTVDDLKAAPWFTIDELLMME